MNNKVAALTAIVVLAPMQSAGQLSTSPLAENYDCVIEPREVADVGSQAEGVLSEIMADRGASVKKGEILAKLNTTVEETNLEL
ncbi:MAG: HlyD family secretion protein, partial [Marinicaulis sp.]|nr:HlyD family secretion protein [Marinicaulis sp.]